jgi:nucleoid-associated protein YgaU
MDLRDKYSHAIQTARNYGMDGFALERDGRLLLAVTVASEAEKDAIWDALKTVRDWQNEVVADIKVKPKPDVDAPVTSMKTHTVKKGDTLSTIAGRYLGNANAHRRIFEANKDQLKDADDIKPGQVLKIPAMDNQIT